MSEFIVHGIPGSPFLRSVLLGLEEKGQPYSVRPLAAGEHQSDDYLRLHPFRRVPVMDHGDFRLYETQAILRYLDDLFPEPPFEPTDAKAAARMNQIVGINDWYLFPHVSVAIMFQRLIAPRLMGIKPDEAAIAAAVPKARVCIDELDRLLGAGRFMAGDRMSIADLILAPPLDYLPLTPEGRQLLAGTALEAWLGRMNERPSMQATQPPEVFRQAA